MANTRERDGKSVATPAQNDKLEHSDATGGQTTRSDRTDQGVPMLPGHASEPVGPEDAFGEGPKRGDYSERQDTSQHFESRPVEGGGDPILGENGQVVDFKPTHELVRQDTRAGDQGKVPEGAKGGVTS